MDSLSFPFWIIACHFSLISFPLESNTSPKHALTISTSRQAAQRLRARYSTAEWEVKMMTRPPLGSIVSDLEQLGFDGLCHDEQPNGT